jgi:Fe-S-cluster-containing dehydrogenase component/CRP-like cAMP-binding protein
MAQNPTTIERPGRWDAAFDSEMTDADVDRLMAVAPFRDMDPEKFPKRTPLRGVLKNDSSIRRFRTGEIVVRQGDYGTSAFLILSGTTRVVLKPDLPPSLLGRKPRHKKGLFRTLAQIWSPWRPPESFGKKELARDSRIAQRTGDDEQVHVFLQDLPRVLNEHRTESMRAGDFFGEIAALSRMPRTSTIFAESDEVELLEIRWQGLRDLMRYDEQLKLYINRIYRERALASFLRATPLFRHLDEKQLHRVATDIEFATYGDYDWSGDYKRLAKAGAVVAEKEPVILREGDYPNGIALIRAGFARLTRKFGNGERTLNYLGAGQVVGFREIAHNWRAPDRSMNFQHSLRAIGYTHLLILPTRTLEEIVLPSLPASDLPEIIPIEETKSDLGSVEAEPSAIRGDVLEFLTANRFYNGTAAMLIDMDRCTRCDDCVRACASTHDNNPRFLRHGPTHGRLMIANACMHCADPVCMIGCPTGAIHRESFEGEVVINPVTCIGCKACYLNCPYDAIRMVDIRDEDGRLMVGEDSKPISKATKCDLCVENHGGPACQRACPHGALERVNLNDLGAIAAWLDR